MKNLFLFLSLILFAACSENDDLLNPADQRNHFCIYFLKDTLLMEKNVNGVAIEELVLDDEPWFNDEDIEFYDFSSHCIYLKKDKSYLLNYYKGVYKPLNTRLISKPFVVTAASKRCYVGALHSDLLSTMPIGPYIGEMDLQFYYPEDVLHISRYWLNDIDMRGNLVVKEQLLKNNKYHAGLEFELKSIIVIENSDTSTIEYSIVIRNYDEDDLMVIDPDKMGSELFHYYTNGPVLRKLNYIGQFDSRLKVVTAPALGSWDNNWFTLIKSKQSIERTVRLKGYPQFPSGEYFSFMEYSNPVTIPKSVRNINGTRIWLGKITSNTFYLTL